MSLPICATIMEDKTLRGRLTGLELAASPVGTYVLAGTQQCDIEGRFDELRMRIVYLCFDVEACRRENQFLRRALEGDGRR